MQRESPFSKARDLIIICLAFEFGIILFTAEVNLCKKSIKPFFGPYITLVNDSIFFPISSILSQKFKAADKHKFRVWSFCMSCLFSSINSFSKNSVMGYFSTFSFTPLFNSLSLFSEPGTPFICGPYSKTASANSWL